MCLTGRLTTHPRDARFDVQHEGACLGGVEGLGLLRGEGVFRRGERSHPACSFEQ
jgi:hypothetical protein